MPVVGFSECPGWISPIGGPILRMRNVRQPGTASDVARVHKHQLFTCGHGGYIYRANLGGPGDENRLLEVPFCEYSMRGSPRPHPTLIRSPSTKHISLSTVSVKKTGYLRGGGVKIADSRAYFRECATHPRIQLSTILRREINTAFNAGRVKTRNYRHFHTDVPFSAKK